MSNPNFNLTYFIIAVVAIAILFAIALLQNAVDEKSIIATPSIPQENAILTRFASMKIKAPPEKVFEIMSTFKDFSKTLTFSQHKWDGVEEDGVPMMGSKGTTRVSTMSEGCKHCVY